MAGYGTVILLNFLYFIEAKCILNYEGYQIVGAENIPPGGAIAVFYHGAAPVDCLYFDLHMTLRRGRMCRLVTDKFFFKLPGNL